MLFRSWEDESWDEIDWETCRLRVRRPGVHLECWIMGGQGSGKSNFCASRIMQAMVQEKGLFWCFALNSGNSRSVQHEKIYYYLPTEYRTATGKNKRTATVALTWAGDHFTEDKFSIANGSKCEFRLYGDNANPASTEGPRPRTVWSDEEISLTWIENINNRLLTRSEEHTSELQSH